MRGKTIDGKTERRLICRYLPVRVPLLGITHVQRRGRLVMRRSAKPKIFLKGDYYGREQPVKYDRMWALLPNRKWRRYSITYR